MRRALPWLAAIFFLGCLALGWLGLRLRSEIALTGTDHQVSAKSEDRQIADLRHQLAAAQAAQVRKEKPVDQPGPQKSGNPLVIHLADILKEHPEYAAILNKELRRNVYRQYGDGLSSLNLSPEQLAKLKDLLVERQMSAMDAQSAAEAAGLQRGSPEWQQAIKQAAQGVEQELAALLGNNFDPMLTGVQGRVSFQNQIQNTYGPDFSDAGAALSPEQSQGLTQALADASFAGKDLSTRPPGYNAADPATGLSPHDNNILNEAAAVLTPAQLQILKTDQIQANQQTAIMRQYRQGGATFIMP